jgi:RHS repeat-associated protein
VDLEKPTDVVDWMRGFARIRKYLFLLLDTRDCDQRANDDADDHLIEKTGSFAQTNLPQPVSGNNFNADNEMTAFNGTAMSYDANGNLTADASNTYAWDARNHLSAISGANTASFVYDPFGRRMNKTIGGTATSFLYDGLNPVQELQSGSPSASMLTGLGIDEYFQRTDASGASSYLTDALGSTLALANPAGGLATSYTYDPFGNTTVAGSSTNPFQFTGRENDGTGLYYYRARYYSPTYQRFITQDPIGFAGGDFNIYAYVSNGPISAVDPTGRGVIDCIRFLMKLPGLLNAKNECQQELKTCNSSSDDPFKQMDSLACQQDFCVKYGAPASESAAVATCACQKAGEGTACVDFLLNGFKCSY